MAVKTAGIDMKQNYVSLTLCIQEVHLQKETERDIHDRDN